MRRKLSSGLLLIFMFLFMEQGLRAQTNYYVDATGGDDSNPGTEAQPWKTISKVNSTAYSAGDHIKFKRGESWAEFIYPTSSGNATAGHIVYEPYGTGADPVLQHGSYGMLLDAKDYIILQGFEITSPQAVLIMDGDDVNEPDHIQILNNKMHGSSIPPAYSSDGGVNIRHDAHHIKVSGNEIYNHYTGIWLGEDAACNNIISGNTLYDLSGNGIGVDEVWCTQGNETVISDNTIYNVSWHGMELSANRHIIEYNTVHHSGTGGHSGIHLFARYDVNDPDKGGDFNIIRNNICHTIYDHDPNSGYRTDGNGIQADQWCDSNFIYNNIAYGNDGAGINIFGSSGNMIFNNTLFDNGHDLGIRYGRFELVIAEDTDSPCEDNIVKNNIGFAAGSDHFAAAIDEISQNKNNRFSNNMWYNSQGANVVGIVKYATHQTDAVAFSTWQGYSWTSGELSADPLFVDQANNDFHLQSASPAVDAGQDTLLTYDYENNPRPLDSTFDIGAYEYGKYWKGAASSDWTNSNNWNDGVIPSSSSSVNIPPPGFYNFVPHIQSSVTIKNLYIKEGAGLELDSGATLEVK